MFYRCVLGLCGILSQPAQGWAPTVGRGWGSHGGSDRALLGVGADPAVCPRALLPRARPAPRPQGKPRARRQGARRPPASPDLSPAAGGAPASRGGGAWEPARGGAGRGGAGRPPSARARGSARRPESRLGATCERDAREAARTAATGQDADPDADADAPAAAAAAADTAVRAAAAGAARRARPPEGSSPSPRPLPPPAGSCPRGSRERHGPRTPGGQLSGARRGPGPRQPAPLPARPPGALRRVLRPLRARPARCPRPAAGRLPLRPRRPARRHRRPGGPPLAWGSPQPAPRPAPGRSSALTVPGAAAPRVARAQRPGGPGGRPHPGRPGSARGGGGVGPGDRGPAAADGGRPQRAVRAAETRRAASTSPITLEGHVQSLHGTPPLTQGSRSPGNGAQLGAYTRPGDVGDSGGRIPPPPDTLASAGDFFCTM